MVNLAQILYRYAYQPYAGLCLLALLLQPVAAETITIGKGSGIVWEGMPFNVTLSRPLHSAIFRPNIALLSVGSQRDYCTRTAEISLINGYRVYPIAAGVGIIPRAVGTATYVTSKGESITYSGTMGLPESRGIGENTHLTPSAGQEWCIPPSMETSVMEFYDKDAPRTANISGRWVIVTDGTQRSSEVKVRQMYAGTFSETLAGSDYAPILTDTTVRISTLECTVNTPTQINFGPVAHDPTPNAELGSLSYPLTTQCSQDTDRINANINLQFRAISGLYQSSPTQLSLTAGGGYITGEIDNGVTGSGSCAVASGIPFDNQAIRIGSITSTQSSQTLNNQVTWRLCSGGPSLPVGNVDAAAEMLVTFN